MTDEQNETTDEHADATPEQVTEPEAEAEAEAEETPVAEKPAAEPEPVAEAAEEPTGEVPAEDAEQVAETTGPTEVSGPEAAPEEAEQPGSRRKRKRMPRPQRHRHVKPKREPAAERAARPGITRLPKPERARGRRQERRGVVVSSAMDKTIVVKVDTVKAHRRYKKVVRRTTKFHAHDEQNAAKVGDLVRIVETRPLSKSKHWRLAEVLEEAK
jgi:small subunit ribosomal protein S17